MFEHQVIAGNRVASQIKVEKDEIKLKNIFILHDSIMFEFLQRAGIYQTILGLVLRDYFGV